MSRPRGYAAWKSALSRLIPDYARLPLLVALLWNCLVYYGSNLITSGWTHHMTALPIDARIPVVPWTASIYLGCYLFWVVGYILSTRQSRESAFRFLSADFLAKTICLVCFLVFPTTTVRPVIDGPGFWDGVMRLIYRADSATNLLPSIHCLVSWMCYLGVRNQNAVPRWYRIFSFWFALAVFLSTLTTRQHVVLDVVCGVAIAGFSDAITVPSGFAAWYTDIFDRLARRRSHL